MLLPGNDRSRVRAFDLLGYVASFRCKNCIKHHVPVQKVSAPICHEQADWITAINCSLLTKPSQPQVPRGAAGFFLLGRIARLSNRQHEAVEWFREALLRDPLLWQAYEELCSLGAACARTAVDRALRVSVPSCRSARPAAPIACLQTSARRSNGCRAEGSLQTGREMMQA